MFKSDFQRRPQLGVKGFRVHFYFNFSPHKVCGMLIIGYWRSVLGWLPVLQVFRMELHHLIHPWKSVSYQEFLVLEKVLVSVLLLNPEMSEISDSWATHYFHLLHLQWVTSFSLSIINPQTMSLSPLPGPRRYLWPGLLQLHLTSIPASSLVPFLPDHCPHSICSQKAQLTRPLSCSMFCSVVSCRHYSPLGCPGVST